LKDQRHQQLGKKKKQNSVKRRWGASLSVKKAPLREGEWRREWHGSPKETDKKKGKTRKRKKH